MKLLSNVLVGSTFTLAACVTSAQAAVVLSDLNSVTPSFEYDSFPFNTTVNSTFFQVASGANQFGGAGFDFAPLDISAEPFLEVSARIGSGNQNAGFNVLLQDSDGTQVGYAFLATSFNTSTFANEYALIATPSFTNVAGSVPGLNTTAITQFQLQGSYSPASPLLLFRFDFDNVAVVPEPATFGLGAIGMLLLARRRTGRKS